MSKNREARNSIGIILEEMMDEQEENYDNVIIPGEIDKKMLDFMKTADEQRERKYTKKREKKYSQICVAAVVAIIVTTTITVASVDALRIKYFGFLLKQNEGNISFTPKEDPDNLLAGWSDYWYPEYIPEGFELIYVENNQIEKLLRFDSKETDAFIIITEDFVQGNIGMDTDWATMTEMEVNGVNGYLFEDDSS
ncbi:MAG: DUF4367 domain-containing protein, partial [Anaerovoracaceae bacterium]